MRMVLVVIILISCILPLGLIAQQNELQKINSLNLHFENRIIRILNNAENNLLTAYETSKSSLVSNNTQKLIKANNEIAASTNVYFEIFMDYCKQFWIRNRQPVVPEIERGKELERRATGHFKQAAFLRQEAIKKVEIVEAAQLFEMATELELLGLLNLARAIRIYQDFPVIYAYEWEDDVEVPRVSPERIAKVLDRDAKNVENIVAPQPNTSEFIITFIVQIAAHTVPIPESYLKTIYTGNMEIEMIFEYPWYKYYLGPFYKLSEAQEKLSSLSGVKNAFIAAYKDNKRINLREAIGIN